MHFEPQPTRPSHDEARAREATPQDADDSPTTPTPTAGDAKATTLAHNDDRRGGQMTGARSDGQHLRTTQTHTREDSHSARRRGTMQVEVARLHLQGHADATATNDLDRTQSAHNTLDEPCASQMPARRHEAATSEDRDARPERRRELEWASQRCS